MQEAKAQWRNNLYSGNELTAVFKNKTYLNLYQGGANKKPRQPERILGDMKRHFENEQCVLMANKVKRYHRTKAGNTVIIKSKLGTGKTDLGTMLQLFKHATNEMKRFYELTQQEERDRVFFGEHFTRQLDRCPVWLRMKN